MSLAGLTSALLAPVKSGAGTGGSFWLPPQASTNAAEMDWVFYLILYGSLFGFVVVVGTTLFFMIKYRHRPGQEVKTSAISGNHRLEVIWTLIPGIFFFVIFLYGFNAWMKTNVAPAEAIEVRVLGKKWSWAFNYSKLGIDGVCERKGAPDIPCMVVPTGKPVKLTMSSEDVIHSFYIPAFRIKRDVLPNRYSVMWFTATKEGNYDVFCAEYCGEGHSRMLAMVRVVSPAAYEKWVKSGGGLDKLPPAERGQKLFVSKGCNACHSVTKEGRGLAGPPLGGKYGAKEPMADGSIVTVDDNYIRESILRPNAKVVKGYKPVMPTFKGQLTDRQINWLIDYIKSLNPKGTGSKADSKKAKEAKAGGEAAASGVKKAGAGDKKEGDAKTATPAAKTPAQPEKATGGAKGQGK
jgi:cytochrome c oxidase subunit 2